MATIKFGTDGVRGHYNQTLTAQDVLRLGLAHGTVLTEHSSGGRPKVVVGRDSRVSGQALLGAYSSGLMSAGVDVVDIGIIPTPAVAFAARELDFQGGAMMSASHNPVPDNGIKLFDHRGKKLGDSDAERVERLIAGDEPVTLADGAAVGRMSQAPEIAKNYHEFLLGSLEGGLEGLKIVLDCAHGAAAGHARAVFQGAGAEVVMLSDTPDGEKINVNCGSTDLGPLGKSVREHSADLGFAFDGDADRCLAVSETGKPLTGDQMMVVIADHLRKSGRLRGDRIVLTVMSNLGAELALRERGVEVTRTPVGDRYVYEEMVRSEAVLGGEQSGHILLLDRHWSGDGMLAGLVFAGIVAQQSESVSHLVNSIPELPQILINVSGVDKSRLESDQAVKAAIAAAESRLGKDGRLLVRPSGTEPLVRLMAEGPDGQLLQSVLEELKSVVTERLSV